MDDMKNGGLVVIFTPDNTHFPIAKVILDCNSPPAVEVGSSATY